jgi:hypothetical protein
MFEAHLTSGNESSNSIRVWWKVGYKNLQYQGYETGKLMKKVYFKKNPSIYFLFIGCRIH